MAVVGSVAQKNFECGQKHAPITQDDAEFLLREASHTPLETAQQLRNMIGNGLYFDYLYKTFSDRQSDKTNGAFSRHHQALLQLPICNVLTLNGDAGPTNARVARHPGRPRSRSLRPGRLDYSDSGRLSRSLQPSPFCPIAWRPVCLSATRISNSSSTVQAAATGKTLHASE